jgi:hypothetical protein
MHGTSANPQLNLIGTGKMNLEHKLAEHHRLAMQLRLIKEEEARLRMEICAELLAGKGPGTHKFSFPHLQVKAVKKFNYKLDQDEIRRLLLDDELTPEERGAIRTKYELSLKEYDKLTDAPLLDKCITVDESMPTLEVEIV